MSLSVNETYRRLNRLDRMPYGVARDQASLELVTRIRAEGPQECFAYALVQLIDTYYFGNQAERAYVPFVELVDWMDNHPDQLDDQDVKNACWAFKLLVGSLPCFPTISKEQVEQALSDMERHFTLAGVGKEVLNQLRFEWAAHLGAPEARDLLRAWESTPRDDISNCELCVPIQRADFLAFSGERQAGIDLIEQVFATLDVNAYPHCRRQPFGGYNLAAQLYLDRNAPGDVARAAAMHQRALRHIGEYGAGEADIGLCIEFAARARAGEHAYRLIKNYGGKGLNADLPSRRKAFLAYLGAATRMMCDDLQMAERTIQIGELPTYTLRELSEWASAQARELARAFDARNGNTTQSERTEAALHQQAWDTEIDLRVVRIDELDELGEVPPSAPPEAALTTTEPSAADELWAAAETDDGAAPGERARRYTQAARLFEAEGRLSSAGFAWAESGMLAGALDDLPGACAALRRAVALLRTDAEVPIGHRAPVERELGLYLAESGQKEQTLAVFATLRDGLGGISDPDEAQRLRNDTDFASAKALLWLGEGRKASELAHQVAQAFAARNEIEAATRAFLIAGRGLCDCGEDEAALWYFESALEGANLRAAKELRSEAIERYVGALRRLGRDAEAEDYLAQL